MSRTPPATSFHGNHATLKICIACPELIGPGATGKLGLAYSATAQGLAAQGHEVTCLYYGRHHESPEAWDKWIAVYQTDGMTLVGLPPSPFSEPAAPKNLLTSYRIFQWLKRNDRFDLVYFPEESGPGYHTMTAKNHGIAFKQTTVCVGLQDIRQWMQAARMKPADGWTEVDTSVMERRMVDMADTVVPAGRYLPDWLRVDRTAAGATRIGSGKPESGVGPGNTGPSAPPHRAINKLVYFGPLQSPKGLALFCDALDCMPSNIQAQVHEAAFVGQESTVRGMPSAEYIAKRAGNWPFPTRIYTDPMQEGHLDYLAKENRLAVVPSLFEDSPARVLDCLVAGVPFVASSVGWVPNLIGPQNAASVCFEPTVGALCAKLCTLLTEGCPPISTGAEPAPIPQSDGIDPVHAVVHALSIDSSNIVALKTLALFHLRCRRPEAAREACSLILFSNENDEEALKMIEEARALEEIEAVPPASHAHHLPRRRTLEAAEAPGLFETAEAAQAFN